MLSDVKIKKINKNLPLSGKNAQIVVDGVVLKGVTEINYTLAPNGLPKVVVTIMANSFDVEGESDENTTDD